MANRWLPLLLGAVLIQGILSASPISVPDEEWDTFNSLTRNDESYRLINTTYPTNYQVTITPHFEYPPVGIEPFTFDGDVTIQIIPSLAGLTEIKMHCDDLIIESVSVHYVVDDVNQYIVDPGQTFACQMPQAFLTIPTTEILQLGQQYVAHIVYRGRLQTDMRGFYLSWYRDATERRWMATTQFQPGHARKAFPCYDEPGYKATFDITIVRDSDFSPTISNMPRSSNYTLPNGKISETFYTTPTTSTYLLAFIVSHYQEAGNNNDIERPFKIYARDNVGSNGDWSQEVGQDLLRAMEEHTQFPYYGMADQMDMKQAAIPDFSAGAMENWGLLTYREALILYDPNNSNHFYRQRVANIVSHEIAHMWFGNLVTCNWWGNLWLNEGFARYYQYYLTGSVREELGFQTRFITEQLHTAMFADSVSSAHALTDHSIFDPTVVSAFFSTISYAKGAAVLRMTEHLLGNETYVEGLRSYLRERAYQVAEPQHLFFALDQAAATSGALDAYNGITIDGYMRTWTEEPGHPLLTVTIDHLTGDMHIVQVRWDRTVGISSIPYSWQIPITWTRGGAPDFNNTKPTRFITQQVTIIPRGTSGLEWVIFNLQQTGFYRVNYDPTTWALLTRALREDEERTAIHEYNRAQIVDDLFAFARAGVLPYERALNILSFLEFEDQYAPWMAAVSGFNFLLRRLAHDEDNLQKLQAEIVRLSAAVTARLGYDDTDSDTYMEGLLRMYIMEFLCNVGHEQCVSAAINHFQRWRNGDHLRPNLRPWVYCVGLREGTAEDFTYFWNRYLQEDLANEIVVMLSTAGCTSDQASLNIFLNTITAGNDSIRSQDYGTSLSSAVTGNEMNTMRVLEWLKTNVERANDTVGITSFISNIGGRLITEAQIQEFDAWLEDIANDENAYESGKGAISGARSNLQWTDNRIAEIAQYLDNGYLEDIIDELNPEPEPGDPDPEGDSANIAALSVVTLIVTLAINFMA